MKTIPLAKLCLEGPGINVLQVFNDGQIFSCFGNVTEKLFLVKAINLYTVRDLLISDVCNRSTTPRTFVSIKRLFGIDFYYPLALTLPIWQSLVIWIIRIRTSNKVSLRVSHKPPTLKKFSRFRISIPSSDPPPFTKQVINFLFIGFDLRETRGHHSALRDSFRTDDMHRLP